MDLCESRDVQMKNDVFLGLIRTCVIGSYYVNVCIKLGSERDPEIYGSILLPLSYASSGLIGLPNLEPLSFVRGTNPL